MRHLLPVLTVSLLSSCMSITSMQSARPNDIGESSYQMGLGSANLTYKLNGKEEVASVPIMEFGGRYGVAKNFDLGAKLIIPGALQIDGKYMILGSESQFALSTGLSYGSFDVSTGEGTSEVKSTFSDISVPIFLTYDVSPDFSLHLTPKYITRNSETTYGNGDPTKSSSESFSSIALGFNYSWFYVEYATISGAEDSFNQVMIGFNTAWDKVQGRPSGKAIAEPSSKSESM